MDTGRTMLYSLAAWGVLIIQDGLERMMSMQLTPLAFIALGIMLYGIFSKPKNNETSTEEAN